MPATAAAATAASSSAHGIAADVQAGPARVLVGRGAQRAERSRGVLVCELGTLQPGGTTSIQVRVRVSDLGGMTGLGLVVRVTDVASGKVWVVQHRAGEVFLPASTTFACSP